MPQSFRSGEPKPPPASLCYASFGHICELLVCVYVYIYIYMCVCVCVCVCVNNIYIYIYICYTIIYGVSYSTYLQFSQVRCAKHPTIKVVALCQKEVGISCFRRKHRVRELFSIAVTKNRCFILPSTAICVYILTPLVVYQPY